VTPAFRRNLFKVLRLVIGLGASVGLGWLAMRGLDWGQVRASLAGVSVPFLVLSVAVFCLAWVVRAYRWKLLLVNQPISIWRLFIIQNEGIGLNNLLPLRIASEAVQLAVLTFRDRMNAAVALATLGMQRILDIIAPTVILLAAVFFVPQMENFSFYVWGAIGLTMALIALVRLLSWSSGSLSLIRRFSFLSNFAAAVRDLERQRLRLAASLACSILYWLLIGLSMWLAAVALDLDISFMSATVVSLGVIFFATSVPSAPSAIGTFEFAVIYILDFFGISREEGLGFAFLTHAILFIPPTVMAVIFLPREGVISLGRIQPRAASSTGVQA
jgi:uncharacterized protein (TIRG00374 family)